MNIQVVEPMTITPAVLPNAQRTKDYEQVLTVSGGVAPYIWEISNGALPTSLQLIPQENTNTAKIKGNVNAEDNNYVFTVKVTDANGNTVEQ